MLGSLFSREYLLMVIPGWNSSRLHVKAPVSIISQKKFLSWANPNNSPEKTICSFHESFNQFFLKILYHNIARGKIQITVSKKWNNLLKFSDKWSNLDICHNHYQYHCSKMNICTYMSLVTVTKSMTICGFSYIHWKF